MKTLVVYYTKTGNTKIVGDAIAKDLDADLEEIIALADIEIQKNPGNYELIVIGTPIWAADMTPAIRNYLTKHEVVLTGKKIAFFLTAKGFGIEKALKKLEEMVPNSDIVGKLVVLSEEVKSYSCEKKVKSFVESL